MPLFTSLLHYLLLMAIHLLLYVHAITMATYYTSSILPNHQPTSTMTHSLTVSTKMRQVTVNTGYRACHNALLTASLDSPHNHGATQVVRVGVAIPAVIQASASKSYYLSRPDSDNRIVDISNRYHSATHLNEKK